MCVFYDTKGSSGNIFHTDDAKLLHASSLLQRKGSDGVKISNPYAKILKPKKILIKKKYTDVAFLLMDWPRSGLLFLA